MNGPIDKYDSTPASVITQKAAIVRWLKTEPLQGKLASVVMSNVLSREKREQVIALGPLGWSLRRIEQATGVRRETAGEYLRGAGIALRRPGGWGRHGPSKAAINPITDSETVASKAAINLITDSDGEDSKPAIEVTTDFSVRQSGCGPASKCEPYGELIALELDRGRNAMGSGRTWSTATASAEATRVCSATRENFAQLHHRKRVRSSKRRPEKSARSEFLAAMLGTHRSSVTVAISTLAKAGLIGYVRGQLTIRNRAGLLDVSCECYRIVHEEAVRLGLFDNRLPDSARDRASNRS